MEDEHSGINSYVGYSPVMSYSLGVFSMSFPFFNFLEACEKPKMRGS